MSTTVMHGFKRILVSIISGVSIGLIGGALLRTESPTLGSVGAALGLPGVPGAAVIGWLVFRMTPHDLAFYDLAAVIAGLFYSLVIYLVLVLWARVRARKRTTA